MKKVVLIIIVLISMGLTFLFINTRDTEHFYEVDGIEMVAKTNANEFMIQRDGSLEATFLKGVNMGAAKPGTFPGELGISQAMYMQWFEWIHEMGGEVIRVYTTLMPVFYDALHAFNQTVDDPIYIMQGVWLNEYDAQDLGNAFGDENRLIDEFVSDAKDLVDIIHGEKSLPLRPGFASGDYTTDVSPYVIGWIMGVEWDPLFVQNTKAFNDDMPPYEGTYISGTPDANAFESFLAEVGDRVTAYEVEQYDFMRPLSFINWPTTDLLDHPNEPDVREDLVSVTMNNLKCSDDFHAGLFASYHIYPYYPEFMNYSLEYRNHTDHRGEINAYHGYLSDLIAQYDMPVIVAEFGVPSSRGKTHDALNSGMNQGFLTEEAQGHKAVHMLEDIYDTNYAGGLLFTWQDEWFKRTWNTMDLDLDHRRPFWSNVQTNEQHFGLMAFDPGENRREIYVDGNLDDWEDIEPIYKENITLYNAHDERYLYIRLDMDTINFNTQDIFIPISTQSAQGNTSVYDMPLQFPEPTDFLIEINDLDKATIKVDAYYDSFYYQYHEQSNALPTNEAYRENDSGHFNMIYQALSNELYLPEENRTIPFSKHPTGILTHGNGNPDAESYNSLADFHFSDNTLELKIPWQLLNVSDPSTKMILSDLYQEPGFHSEFIDRYHIGAKVLEDNHNETTIPMVETQWKSWEYPTYHMRLKPSYYIFKEALLSMD